MSTLTYASIFRIEKPKTVAKAEAEDGKPEEPSDEQTKDSLKDYINRLTKLIPVEVLGIYLTVRAWTTPPVAAEMQGEPDSFLAWWPVVCIALVIVSRVAGTQTVAEGWKTVQPKGVLIAVISFILWVYAMGHTILDVAVPDPRWISAAVVVWTFLIPKLYRGEA